MTSASPIEQLNESIEWLLADRQTTPPRRDEAVSELVELAGELRYLPRAEFKASLEAELQEQADAMAAASVRLFVVAPATDDQAADLEPAVLPTLLGDGYGDYPVHRSSFAASFVLHAAAAVLIASSGLWMAQHREHLKTQVTTELIEPGDYVLRAARDEAHGGGGGGDADHLPAAKGSLPRFAREQLAPPAMVIRNETPKLPAEATVVGPPQLTFPLGRTGLPLSAALTPSNGSGTGGGMGTGSGGGVGSGIGGGVGPGSGGGTGGGVFTVGGGVSAPRVIYDPEPDFTEEARKARYQGTVVLWAVIGANGYAKDLQVRRSLGMGLDEKAIEAVRKWRFEPAKKDGHPVAVQVSIEVSFRLY